ncbi:hypothetical protein [Candidatus Ichthyocystis hellenicum]|uniref:hypothetical protein n=1 Tax=Candidatus Ichthyocystis hellenicum TaxID=1561003 RepID=UPI00111252B4|nr:hypothetical protein [Candidatus Ichthyocystis hellenicum]
MVPLAGSRLRDFWASLDQGILSFLRDLFVKWTIVTTRFSVPSFFSLVPGEVSSALCGGNFFDACAKDATSLPSVSRFASIAGGMIVQAAPHGSDYVDLFGSEVLPEVKHWVDLFTPLW